MHTYIGMCVTVYAQPILEQGFDKKKQTGCVTKVRMKDFPSQSVMAPKEAFDLGGTAGVYLHPSVEPNTLTHTHTYQATRLCSRYNKKNTLSHWFKSAYTVKVGQPQAFTHIQEPRSSV